MSNSSICPIDRTLLEATAPGQIGPGSDGNEGVHHIPQRFKTGALPSDGFLSNSGYSLGEGSYPSAEMSSVYSTAPVDWTDSILIILNYF